MLPFIHLTEEPLSPAALYELVRSDACGAIDMFIGTVRNQTHGRPVERLEFEAYAPMAVRQMRKIADRVGDTWPIDKMAIHHRVGTLQIGDIAVIIAVSTPHRAASFDACRFAIDSLKESVPIWKKEIFTDGEQWVAAHP
ncbi:MAG: molybdenum cofactor biosynthesis protein MoaE [Bacteroidota bacterium]